MTGSKITSAPGKTHTLTHTHNVFLHAEKPWVALQGGCGSQSARGCARPPALSREMERVCSVEKEKLTPDDAGADKTANDNVCESARSPDCFWLFAIISCLAYCPLPRLPLVPAPQWFYPPYFLALRRLREEGKKRERTVSRSYPRNRSSHAYQRVLRKVLHAMSPRRLQRDKLADRSRAATATHVRFAKLATMDFRRFSRLPLTYWLKLWHHREAFDENGGNSKIIN